MVSSSEPRELSVVRGAGDVLVRPTIDPVAYTRALALMIAEGDRLWEASRREVQEAA